MEQENKTEERLSSDEEVKDAQIVSEDFSETKEEESLGEEKNSELPKDQKKRTRVDYYIEVALFLVLGVLVGIAVKNEAVKKITMGYDDYQMKIKSQDYKINQIQEELIKKRNEESAAQEEQENQNGAQAPSQTQDQPQLEQ